MIGILSPTYWEVRSLIHSFSMRKEGTSTYRYDNNSVKLLLEISGIGSENAERAGRFILSYRPNRVYCVGFAGALREGIKAGDLVLDNARSDPKLAEEVKKISETFKIPIHSGKFLTCPHPIMKKADKLKVSQSSSEIAVEMESEALSQICGENKIPFCSLRSVSDILEQDLPSIITALDSRGKIGFKFWQAFITHPEEWNQFFRLVRSSRSAERNLCKILGGILNAPKI